MKSFCLALAILLSAAGAHAADQVERKENLTVTITEIATPAEQVALFMPQALLAENSMLASENMHIMEGGGIGLPSIGDLTSWLNIGKQIWDIIEGLAGKMTFEPMTGVGVIPETANSVTSMSSWKVARPKSYHMEIAGSFGTAFNFDYTVGFNYGGKYKGNGSFLANVSIVPFNAKCGWTWNCAAKVNVGQAINVGDDQNPNVAMPITMVVNAQGHVNAKAAGVQLTVYGDGRLEQLVSDNGQGNGATGSGDNGGDDNGGGEGFIP